MHHKAFRQLMILSFHVLKHLNQEQEARGESCYKWTATLAIQPLETLVVLVLKSCTSEKVGGRLTFTTK